MSGAQRTSVQVKLNLAGNPGHVTPPAFEAIRYGAAAVLVALPLLLGLLLGLPFTGLVAAVIGGALGFWLPVIVLNQMASARRTAIERNLPDAVDLLTLAVEAGLSLDAGWRTSPGGSTTPSETSSARSSARSASAGRGWRRWRTWAVGRGWPSCTT